MHTVTNQPTWVTVSRCVTPQRALLRIWERHSKTTQVTMSTLHTPVSSLSLENHQPLRSSERLCGIPWHLQTPTCAMFIPQKVCTSVIEKMRTFCVCWVLSFFFKLYNSLLLCPCFFLLLSLPRISNLCFPFGISSSSFPKHSSSLWRSWHPEEDSQEWKDVGSRHANPGEGEDCPGGSYTGRLTLMTSVWARTLCHGFIITERSLHPRSHTGNMILFQKLRKKPYLELWDSPTGYHSCMRTCTSLFRFLRYSGQWGWGLLAPNLGNIHVTSYCPSRLRDL